jgi:hypothetical protein
MFSFSRFRVPSSITCPAVESSLGFQTTGRSAGRRPPKTRAFHLGEEETRGERRQWEWGEDEREGTKEVREGRKKGERF